MQNIKLSEIKTKNKNKKQVVVKPVKIPRNVERQFQAQIKSYSNQFKKMVRTEIFPLIETFATQTKLTNDGIGEDINTAIENLKSKFDFVGIASTIASTMVNRVASINAKKTASSVNNAIGVDVDNIIASENLSEFVEMQVIKNSELIKSVPQQAIEDIRRIVLNGLSEGLRAEEIQKQISGTSVNSTFNKINNRIATIARTETAKINSQITNRRLLNLGITKAVWDATGDSRTRECHMARDGKEFDISKGLYSSCDGKTILPGSSEINCRCVARPIVE